MATHSSTPAWRIPRTEEPLDYGSRGPKESDTTEWLKSSFWSAVGTSTWSESWFWLSVTVCPLQKTVSILLDRASSLLSLLAVPSCHLWFSINNLLKEWVFQDVDTYSSLSITQLLHVWNWEDHRRSHAYFTLKSAGTGVDHKPAMLTSLVIETF